jgi:hypothetical protein
MPPGVFSQSPNPEQIQECVQYYIAQINSNIGFKKQITQHLAAQRLSHI